MRVLIEWETASTPEISSSSSEDLVPKATNTEVMHTKQDAKKTYQFVVPHNQPFKKLVVFQSPEERLQVPTEEESMSDPCSITTDQNGTEKRSQTTSKSSSLVQSRRALGTAVQMVGCKF